MRCSAIVIGALALVSLHPPLSAQAAPGPAVIDADTAQSASGPAARPLVVASSLYLASAPLPAVLAPDAAARPNSSAAAWADNGPTPYLLGVVGGVAGLFVGKWAMTRGCEENCAQQALLGGLVGILGGAALGYLIGGGEMVPPPRR